MSKQRAPKRARPPARTRRRVLSPSSQGLRMALGTLVPGPDANLYVDYAGNREGVLCAQTLVPISSLQKAQWAEERRALVLLLPEEGVPIVVGFLQPLPLEEAPSLDLRGDLRRVELEAPDELVLKCGEASLTLRKNGRVVVKGTQVESHAKGLNRIKGGIVSIN